MTGIQQLKALGLTGSMMSKSDFSASQLTVITGKNDATGGDS